MLTADDTLLEHLAACEVTYQLMLDENRMLKATSAPPGDDFLEQKRSALGKLDSALASLRALGDCLPNLSARERATIVKTQQIVLKALLLDRENEQLLFKCALTSRRAAMPQVRPTLDQIQRLYRKHGGANDAPVQ
jgi:hypothetical protein